MSILDRQFATQNIEINTMIDLKHSLTIEATEDPNFFGFFSTELEGFSGVGHSIEDCIYKAKWGMEEHIQVMQENGIAVPAVSFSPSITIVNENTHPVAITS